MLKTAHKPSPYATSPASVVMDRILVKPETKPRETEGGIQIPDSAIEEKSKPKRGTVFAVGQGRLTSTGERVPLEVHVGDVVMYAGFSGTEIELDGEKYRVLEEREVLAVVG